MSKRSWASFVYCHSQRESMLDEHPSNQLQSPEEIKRHLEAVIQVPQYLSIAAAAPSVP
jgi:hypothetical protein